MTIIGNHYEKSIEISTNMAIGIGLVICDIVFEVQEILENRQHLI